jgi:large subunit ribosomal protein L24
MKIEYKKISLRKNDLVQVMTGKEKGKTAKILKIDPNGSSVLLEKVNVVSRRYRKTAREPGKVVEKELPIHYSNVLLMCSACNRGVRHGVRVLSKENRVRKVRFCKRCDHPLDAA